MRLLAKIAINTIALFIVAYIIPGFTLASVQAAIVAAIIMGVMNAFIRPILQIIALPITILTLGIFAFFINVTLLWFVSYLVPGFDIANFTVAAVSSILLSLIVSFLEHSLREG
jgi:putative membrane protein